MTFFSVLSRIQELGNHVMSVCRFSIAGNVLCVAAVGDFGALHCQPAQKFDRSTQLQFCTSPPIEATRCYKLPFCLSCLIVCSFYCCLGALAWWLFCKTWLWRGLVRFCKCATKCVGYAFSLFPNVVFKSLITKLNFPSNFLLMSSYEPISLS